MAGEGHETPNKSFNRTYLGSTQKRTQSPFSRRTWDVNAKVSSPFRRLADSGKRSPVTSSSPGSRSQTPKMPKEDKSDEIMDWISSIKQRAQVVLQAEEEEEKKFYEEVEKEKRQIESQNQINTEAFDKLKLFLDQNKQSPAAVEPSSSRQYEHPKNMLSQNKRYSEKSDAESSDAESSDYEEEIEEVEEVESEDNNRGRNLLEEVDEESEEQELDDEEEEGEESEEEEEHDFAQQDVEYDAEGRPIFTEDTQFIELSSDEEVEEEKPTYKPEEFSTFEDHQYVPTPQYQSMYANQSYIPNSHTQQSVAQTEETAEEVIDLSEEGDEGSNAEDDEEYDEEELEYESQENDHEDDHSDRHVHFRDEQGETNAEDENTSYDYTEMDPNLLEGLEDIDETVPLKEQTKNNVESYSDSEGYNEDEQPDFSDNEVSKEDFEQENAGQKPMEQQTGQQNDMAQFELLASAALTQISDNSIAKQNEETPHSIEATEEETNDITEAESENEVGSECGIIADEDEGVKDVSQDSSPEVQVSGIDTEAEEEDEISATESDHFKKNIIGHIEGENVQQTNAPNEDTKRKLPKDVDDPQNVEAAKVQPEEYEEEQYYDSDNEPFRSPSHSLFGSLTVDEVSAIQEDEEDEEVLDVSEYSTGNILDEIDHQQEEKPQEEEIPREVAQQESQAIATNNADLVQNRGDSPKADPSKEVLFNNIPTEKASEDQKHSGFVSFFNIKPLDERPPSISFNAVSEEFARTLKSRESTPIPIDATKKNGFEEKLEDESVSVDNVSNENEISNKEEEGKSSTNTDVSSGQNHKWKSPHVFGNVLSAVTDEVKDVDKLVEKSLGEDPESFVDNTKIANERLVSNLNEVIHKEADKIIESSLGETPEEFVEHTEAPKEGIKVKVDDVISKEADSVLSTSLGQSADEFVDDFDKAAESINPITDSAKDVDDQVFAKSIGEVAGDFVTDASQVTKELAATSEGTIEKISNELNDIAEEGAGVVEGMARVASEKVEEALENSEIPPQPAEMNKLENDENRKKQEDRPKQSKTIAAPGSSLEFEVPDVVKNALREAIKTANRIEELGENFTEDDQKPQLNRAMFNKKPDVSQSKVQYEPQESITRKIDKGKEDEDDEPTNKISKKKDEKPVQNELKSEQSTRKRKYEEAEDDEPAGVFFKLRKFAKFVKRELSSSLEAPITDTDDMEVDEKQAVEEPGTLKEEFEQMGKVVSDIAHDRITEAVEAGESFKHAVQVKMEEAGEAGESVADALQDKIEEGAEVGADVAIALQNKVEEAVENPVSAEAREDGDGFLDQTADTIEEFTSFAEEEMEKAIDHPIEENAENQADEDGVLNKVADTVENFSNFVENQVEETIVEPVEGDTSENSKVEAKEGVIDKVADTVEDFGNFVENQVEEAIDNPVEGIGKTTGQDEPVSPTVDLSSKEGTTSTVDIKNSMNNVTEAVKDFTESVEEKMEESLEDPVSNDQKPSVPAKEPMDYQNMVEDKEKLVTGEGAEEASAAKEDHQGLLEKTVEKVEEFGSFLEEKVEESIEAPVEATPEVTELPKEGNSEKEPSTTDKVLETAEDFKEFVDDTVEQTLETPVSGEGKTTEALNEEGKNVPDKIVEGVSDFANFVENKMEEEVENPVAGDQADTHLNFNEDEVENEHGTNEENLAPNEVISTNIGLQHSESKPAEHRSPLKRVFDYFFNGKDSKKESEVEQLDKIDTEPIGSEEPSSPIERPSKRFKKTHFSSSPDFHDHIIMKTRSGKIIGANSKNDIAEAEHLEEEEEEMIDRIAHGELHTGHVLHELALEHERLEHENKLREELEESEVQANAKTGQSKDLEINVGGNEEAAVNDANEESKKDDSKDLETKVEDPEEPVIEETINQPKRKGRNAKRSRTEEDATEGSQKTETFDTRRKTRSKSRGRQRKEPPPPTERKLRSRTK